MRVTRMLKAWKNNQFDRDVFSINLIKLREADGRPQKEQAALSGVSDSTFSNYVNGNKANPSVSTAWLLADFYGISIDEIVGHEVKNNKRI